MRKRMLIAAILCLVLVLPSCSVQMENASSNNDTNKFTNEQWIEDINYLENNLSEKHINVYHTLSKKEYEQKFNELKSEVSKLKDFQIKLRLAQIVASVGDAHTALYLNQDANGKVYPIGVSWFGNNLKVFAIDKSYEKVIGGNLTAINGIPIGNVMSRIDTLISHENEQWLKCNDVNYINMPEVLKFFDITKTDTAEFTFCNNDGKIMEINLTPEIITSQNIINISNSIINKPIAKQHDDSNYYDNLYWYKYIPDDKIIYFQYNQCVDRNTAKMIGIKDYDKYPDFNKFSDKLIKELNEKDVEKFIIDLRDNSGGNSTLMDNFVDKLNSIKKFNTKGKIYVLIGRGTISSGVFACVSLKKSTNAIFIGEPTGGNVNGYGDILMLTLPNSKIQVSYSTKYFEVLPEYKENFIPNILVEQSFDDNIKGIDDVYEAAKNYKIN